MKKDDAIGRDFGGEYDDPNEPSLIEQACEVLLKENHFMTIQETDEIWYYDNGVYVKGGEKLIEIETEKMLGYQLKNHDLAEIKSHIRRRTNVKMEEVDANINTINLKNGLYDIDNDRLLNHTPAYYSINQKPITYNKDAKPKRFGSFLKEVLYSENIRMAIDAMAYTFHRDYIVEVFYFLVGLGANGKSVFTKLLTAMHGRPNVSNVSLRDITNNQFARSDLEYKDVNIDNELSSQTINDTSILKLLTAGILQPIRIERKNQRAYDAILYAKLFFNTNNMPLINDNTNADDRRRIIIAFPNIFDGKAADKDLLHKLTNETEMSGIFNVLMRALRLIRKNKDVYVNEKTVEQKRAKYERASNPIKAFKEEAIDESLSDAHTVSKKDLYNAYSNYCKLYTLPVEKYNTFCKKMKNAPYYLKDKQSYEKDENGEFKKTPVWTGIGLFSDYSQRQKTLDEDDDN